MNVSMFLNRLERISKNVFAHLMPDELYLRILYRFHMGYWMDFDNPKTFNEKTQWLKLHDHNPIYHELVDKYEVKKHVAKLIGEKYIIPTLGIYDNVNLIDFDSLPSQFVIKCTHDSGSVIICKDKNIFDKRAALTSLTKMLNRSHYWFWREWAYKDVKPRIIVEKYMEDDTDKELRDYKFYCFDGKPHRLLLATDRQIKGGLCFDYFDMDFNHLPMTNHWHPNAKTVPHKPKHFEEMRAMAEKLATGIPQVRVDFYEANDKVYFGEMTFYDMGGFLKIHPDDWDAEWGSLITLPVK